MPIVKKEPEVVSSENLLDGFISEAELCHMLGKHPRTLHRWHVSHQGPPRIVLGRTILYRKTSVLDWLSSREERRAAKRRR